MLTWLPGSLLESPISLSPPIYTLPFSRFSLRSVFSNKSSSLSTGSKSDLPKMGICSSCESTSIATAKLILQDGRLQEFPYPVKASYLLQKDPSIFICNSDEMDFGDVVSAISADEELQPGQLYFALPISNLKRRLKAEEMAALAVKASSALSNCGGEKYGCRRKGSDFLVEKKGKGSDDNGSAAAAELRRARSTGGSGRRGKFTARLTAIPE